jgi:hypothetical protein
MVMNKNIFRMLSFFGFVAVLMFSCDGLTKKGLVAVSAGDIAANSRGYLGDFSDVTRAEVDIFAGETYHYQAQALSLSGSDWAGSFEVPLNVALTFEVRAYGSVEGSEAVIFSGSTKATVTSSGQIVAMNLSPVSDGESVLFPSLICIEMTTQVSPATDYPAALVIKGTPGESVSFEIEVASGGGVFTPASGSIVVGNSGIGRVNLVYTSPANSGSSVVSYLHYITLTNSQANSCRSSFSTVINYESANSFDILFAPYVSSISVVKSGSNLVFTAVAEDENVLTVDYEWKLDDAVFSSGSSSATLTGYSQLTSGIVTLTLTDEDSISNVLTFQLEEKLFPDNVVISTMPDPLVFSCWLFWINDKPESEDKLLLQVKTDETEWATVHEFNGDDVEVAETKTFELNYGEFPALFESSFKFRFFQTDYGSYDDCFVIDSISVSRSGTVLFSDSFDSSSVSSVSWPIKRGINLTNSSSFVEDTHAVYFYSSYSSSSSSPYERYLESKMIDIQ